MYKVCYVQQLLDISPMNRKSTGTTEDGNNSLITQTHKADPDGFVGNSLSMESWCALLAWSNAKSQCPAEAQHSSCKFISWKAQTLLNSVLPEWVIHSHTPGIKTAR